MGQCLSVPKDAQPEVVKPPEEVHTSSQPPVDDEEVHPELITTFGSEVVQLGAPQPADAQTRNASSNESLMADQPSVPPEDAVPRSRQSLAVQDLRAYNEHRQNIVVPVQELLADLKLTKQLGAGGFSTVYQGLWRNTTSCAVKIFATPITNSSSQQATCETPSPKDTSDGRPTPLPAAPGPTPTAAEILNALPLHVAAETLLSKDMAHPNVVQTYAVRCALFTPDFAAALAAAKSADTPLAQQALMEEAAMQAHAVAEMRAGAAGVQRSSRTPLQPWSGSGTACASGSTGAGMGKGMGIALQSVFSTGGSTVEDEGGGGGGSNAYHATEGVMVQGRLPALERLKSLKGAGGSGGSSRGQGGSVDLLGTQALMEAAGAFAARGISQRPRSANVLLGSMQTLSMGQRTACILAEFAGITPLAPGWEEEDKEDHPGSANSTPADAGAAAADSLPASNVLADSLGYDGWVEREATRALSWLEVMDALGAQVGDCITVLVMAHARLGTLWNPIQMGLFLPGGYGAFSHHMRLRALLRTAREIGTGLQHLHEAGVVHADIKPGNILLMDSRADKRGFLALVGDFGLSQVINSRSGKQCSGVSGTLQYMAPEMLSEKLYSRASDVYAFGIMLYEMASGQPAFKDMKPAELLACIQQGQRPTWPFHTFPGMRELYLKCTAFRPEDRPTSTQVVEELGRLEAAVRADAHAAARKPSAPTKLSAHLEKQLVEAKAAQAVRAAKVAAAFVAQVAAANRSKGCGVEGSGGSASGNRAGAKCRRSVNLLSLGAGGTRVKTQLSHP